MSTVPGAQAPAWRLPERLLRNVLSNSASTALGAGAQLVALLVTSQCLATPAYAAYLVAIALVGVAEMASDFGARVWAAQQFALGERPAAVLRSALAAKGLYSALMLAVLAVLPMNGIGLADILLCGLVAITQSSSDPTLWYLRGIARLDVEAVIVLANRIAAAAAACVLALAGYGVTAILIAWLVTNLVRIAVSVGLPATRPLFQRTSARVARPRQDDARRFSALLAITLPLGASLLLISLFQRAGVLLMDSAGTPLDVALFGTSYKFASTASLLATSIALAHFPELVRQIGAGRTDDANRILRHEVLGVTALFAPLCLAGIVAGPLLGEAILGAGLADAGRVLSVLMPGLFISSVNIATKFTLNALGRNWLDAAYALAGLAAFCVLFYAPICDSMCLRAAIAWTAGETLIFLLRGLAIRRGSSGLSVPAPLVLAVTAALSLAAIFVWQIS